MKLWIVTYTNRHGADVWPRFAEEEPTEEAEIAELGNSWEGESAGDYLEISGPFDLPSGQDVMVGLPVTEDQIRLSLDLSCNEWDRLPDSVRQALVPDTDSHALRDFVWSLREDLENMGFDDDREIDGADFVGYGCQLYGDVMDLIRGPIPLLMQLGESA